MLPLALHHTIHDFVDGPIAPMSNNQVIALVSSPCCQCDTVPTILDKGIVSFPSSCCQHSDDIGQLCHVLPRPGINHYIGMLPTHTISPCSSVNGTGRA